MKKQKIFLTFLLAALMLTAAGCGNSDSSSKSESKPETGTSDAVAEDSSTPDAEPSEAVTEATEVTASKAESASEAASAEEPESTKPQAASNTTYDVGEFSVFVPEGWNAIAVPDHIDSSKTATNDILMAKGAEYKEASGSWDYENGPYFYITLLGKEDFAKASSSRDYYVDQFGSVKDMEDMTAGSLTWHGFSVNPIGADVYMIWAEKGEGGFYSSISTAYGLSLQDEDVQKILSSLT